MTLMLLLNRCWTDYREASDVCDTEGFNTEAGHNKAADMLQNLNHRCTGMTQQVALPVGNLTPDTTPIMCFRVCHSTQAVERPSTSLPNMLWLPPDITNQHL